MFQICLPTVIDLIPPPSPLSLPPSLISYGDPPIIYLIISLINYYANYLFSIAVALFPSGPQYRSNVISEGWGLGVHINDMLKGVGHWWTIPPAQADEGYLQQLPQPLSTTSTSTSSVKEQQGSRGGGGLCLLSSRRVFLGDSSLLPPSKYNTPHPNI